MEGLQEDAGERGLGLSGEGGDYAGFGAGGVADPFALHGGNVTGGWRVRGRGAKAGTYISEASMTGEMGWGGF